MRVVIQRVLEATVLIKEIEKRCIGKGLLLLVGIEDKDGKEDVEWLSQKIIQLRIFNDADGKMNLSLKEVNGNIMLISQFTLHASTKKGNRPSYIRAARPEIAIPVYEQFIHQLENDGEKKIITGEFGADMKVSLVNDGPVTIIIDSKNRE